MAADQRWRLSVVLLGNSGGGSLVGYYQAQAKRPPAGRLEKSPGGPDALRGGRNAPADALVIAAAHRGQGKCSSGRSTRRSWTRRTPSAATPRSTSTTVGTASESRPRRRRSRPTSSRASASRSERVRRIDERARALLAEHAVAAEESERPGFLARPFVERQEVLRRRAYEPVFVVHRTMANPAYVDPTHRRRPRGRHPRVRLAARAIVPTS